MKRIFILAAFLSLSLSTLPIGAAPSLERDFLKPPDESRPWVYWFWLNGNITKEGITADLEAMKQAGIRGVLIMEVDQGTPVGPADFMGDQWRELFRHVHKEARRLDLEVNMNNDAGWNGSGGPWIKPELAMQKLVWTETEVTGPKHFDATLARPEAAANFYRDISAMAFPKTGAYRIPNIRSKALFEMGPTGPTPATNLAPENVLDRKQIRLLKGKMDENGRLVWDVPQGEWTVLRLGYTTTGVENAPAPKTGRGLECDKLSKQGIAANFEGMMDKLVTDNRIKPKGGKFGLNATHIDSWENGSQNWSATMRSEFWERRGYDLEEFLPVVTGRVVGSLGISERFLWDLRQTISELVIDNYAGAMRDLAHSRGLRFTVEAYGSPCDHLPYAGRSDEPMGEFWTPSGSALETCRGMASAGHVYGKTIIGAEAFTAGDHERWREHPAVLKALGDRAFCEGINRFVFHRYAMQPWVPERAPGMMMGPWGQHYERTQTWWHESAAWHEYLARCQYLLRQGMFVADICYLQSEAPPQGFGSHPRAGYGWDECPPEMVRGRMAVEDDRLTLDGGMSYRVLVLPGTDAMTPELLRAIKELARSGATVIGSPPDRSPSLKRYPQCDQEVKALVAEFWADCDGVKIKKRRVGKGWLVRGMEPEEYLRETGVKPDFIGDRRLNYIHRATETEHIYFVANSAQATLQTSAGFRVTGKEPELWFPETGRISKATVYHETNGVTTVGLELPPAGSVFVVFRKARSGDDPVVSVSKDGKALLVANAPTHVPIRILSAAYGVPGDTQRTRDVRTKVQSLVDSGRVSFPAPAMAEGDDPAPAVAKTLSVTYTVGDKQFTVVAKDPATIQIRPSPVRATVEKARYGVLTDPARTRDVREKLQALLDSGESSFRVARMAEGDDPAYLVVKTLEADYTIDGKTYHLSGTDPEEIDFAAPEFGPEGPARLEAGTGSRPVLEAREAGMYEAVTASGRRLACEVKALPAPVELTGSWQVQFGTPKRDGFAAGFDKLISWSEHADSKVRYFSGSAAYTTRFTVPRDLLSKNRRLTLDLGEVQVMARVKLNGRDLGLLWKRPFQVDVTGACKAGENRLEVSVINLWPNRLIGDEQLPEDSERNPDGTLKRWPAWLAEDKPSPAGRSTFVSWRLWKKQDALLRSGLIGPVKLIPAEVRELKLQ
jgi:hypothetical protein